MEDITLPPKAQASLLQDAMRRDRTTARRVSLLRILWKERYLTRAHLVARLEGEIGRGCFGSSAWDDSFFRDMSVVKKALKADGYRLVYSRSSDRPGYYIKGQPRLGENLIAVLDGSVSELDKPQIQIIKNKTPAERFHMGASISDTARRVVAYRLQLENPQLSQAEASRLALSQNGNL